MITNEFQRLNPGHWSLIFTWWTIPEPGGMISMLWNAVDPHLRQANHSLFLSNSSSMLACTALSDLTTSAVTEWSITRSAGTWTHKCRTKYDYTKKNPRKIGFLPKKKEIRQDTPLDWSYQDRHLIETLHPACLHSQQGLVHRWNPNFRISVQSPAHGVDFYVGIK